MTRSDIPLPVGCLSERQTGAAGLLARCALLIRIPDVPTGSPVRNGVAALSSSLCRHAQIPTVPGKARSFLLDLGRGFGLARLFGGVL